MIISEDHILQAERNKLTRSPLACAYPFHLIIKNIKKALTCQPQFVNLSCQGTLQTEINILPIVTPSSYIGKLFTATINENWHTIANDTTLTSIWPSKPQSVYTKYYQSIPNPAAFTTILSALHKHMAPHGRIPNTTTHTHPHEPTKTYPQWYTHNSYTFFPLLRIRHTQLILLLRTT